MITSGPLTGRTTSAAPNVSAPVLAAPRYTKSSASASRLSSLGGLPRRFSSILIRDKPKPFSFLEAAASTWGDLILVVAGHLTALRDVFNFGLTKRALNTILLPTIYASVELKSNKQCISTLSFLSEHPKISNCIRELVLRPNHIEWSLKYDEFLEESWVWEMIEYIAKDLPNIHTFVWDGMEMPGENMWLILRKECPLLRSVGSCVGSKILDSNSHLFDFRDLVGFSMTVKQSSDTLPASGTSYEQFPDKLWELLLTHCPNLQELTFEFSNHLDRLYDIRRSSQGRWSALKSLTIGNAIISDTKAPSAYSPFMAFLTNHPTLEFIAFHHSTEHQLPETLSLPSTALPRLKSFTGMSSHIAGLPQPLVLQSYQHSELLSMKTRFSALVCPGPIRSCITSLTFAVKHDGKPWENASALKSLFKAVPQLVHLDISCLTPVYEWMDFLNFMEDEFSIAIGNLKNLETLKLTKIQWSKGRQDDMILTADKILRSHPRLRHLTLRRVRPRKEKKQWSRLDDLRLVQMGIYEVVPDGVDNCSMLVREWKIKRRVSFRRFKRRLRLVSYQYTDEADDFAPRLTLATSPVSNVVVSGRGG